MPQIRRKAKVDIEPIITRLLSYHSQRELAKQLGVDRSTIRRRTKVKVPIARLAHIILLHDEHKNITLKQLFTEHFAFENTYLQKPQINLNSPKNRPFLELLDKYSQFNHHQWSQWFSEKFPCVWTHGFNDPAVEKVFGRQPTSADAASG